MIRSIFLVVLSLTIVYFGLAAISKVFEIPRSEIISWTGIIFMAYLLEKGLKYMLLLPFKMYLKDVRKNSLGKGIQEMGISLSYISVWLAVGFTPINGIVKGQTPEKFISYPIFLKIAFVLILTTVLFSILWWASLRVKK